MTDILAGLLVIQIAQMFFLAEILRELKIAKGRGEPPLQGKKREK